LNTRFNRCIQLSYFSQLCLTLEKPRYDQAYLDLIALIIQD
jgi:hypothetical protein